MIVQFILKGLFFYFLFLFIRSFFRGNDRSQKEYNTKKNYRSGDKRGAGYQKSDDSDVVEAEFKRL